MADPMSGGVPYEWRAGTDKIRYLQRGDRYAKPPRKSTNMYVMLFEMHLEIIYMRLLNQIRLDWIDTH